MAILTSPVDDDEDDEADEATDDGAGGKADCAGGSTADDGPGGGAAAAATTWRALAGGDGVRARAWYDVSIVEAAERRRSKAESSSVGGGGWWCWWHGPAAEGDDRRRRFLSGGGSSAAARRLDVARANGADGVARPELLLVEEEEHVEDGLLERADIGSRKGREERESEGRLASGRQKRAEPSQGQRAGGGPRRGRRPGASLPAGSGGCPFPARPTGRPTRPCLATPILPRQKLSPFSPSLSWPCLPAPFLSRRDRFSKGQVPRRVRRSEAGGSPVRT